MCCFQRSYHSSIQLDRQITLSPGSCLQSIMPATAKKHLCPQADKCGILWDHKNAFMPTCNQLPPPKVLTLRNWPVLKAWMGGKWRGVHYKWFNRLTLWCRRSLRRVNLWSSATALCGQIVVVTGARPSLTGEGWGDVYGWVWVIWESLR